MFRITKVIPFLFFILLTCQDSSAAWLWEEKPLVVINGIDYSSEDFLHWWENWKADDTPFPQNLDTFIEWHLQVQEAKRMELFREPEYLRKVNVFLKARSMMFLKADEIDSKINLSREKLWEFYQKEYSPRREVEILFFSDNESAAMTMNDITAGKLSFDALQKQEVVEHGPKFKQTILLRPNTKKKYLPEQLWSALTSMHDGEIAPPSPWAKNYVIMRLSKTMGPDETDFNSLTAKISDFERKQQQNDLSVELFQRLREKYPVTIEEELLQSLDILAPDPARDILSLPLITVGQEKISVEAFLNETKPELSYRQIYRYEKEQIDSLKKRIVENLITQVLITQESLSRHYEEKPFFKPGYQFYCENRLIKELESLFFKQNMMPINEEMAKKYYLENQKEFHVPEKIKIAKIKDDEKLIKKILSELNRGGDFFQVTRKYYTSGIASEELELSAIDPALLETLKPLTKGEVTSILNQDKEMTLIKLLDRLPETVTPYEEVKEKIITDLERNTANRLHLLLIERLRAASDIKANLKAWQKIKTDFEGQNDKKDN